MKSCLVERDLEVLAFLGLSPPALCQALGVSRQAIHRSMRRGESVVEGIPSLSRLLKS